MTDSEVPSAPRFNWLVSAEVDPDSGDITVPFMDEDRVGYTAVLSRHCAMPLLISLRDQLAKGPGSNDQTVEGQPFCAGS